MRDDAAQNRGISRAIQEGGDSRRGLTGDLRFHGRQPSLLEKRDDESKNTFERSCVLSVTLQQNAVTKITCHNATRQRANRPAVNRIQVLFKNPQRLQSDSWKLAIPAVWRTNTVQKQTDAMGEG